MLIVFDLDGTLANIDHRLQHIKQKPKNWAAFDAAIPADAVNEPVAAAFWSLASTYTHDIILASGRSERTRAATEAWLRKHGLVGWQKLYMRKTDDYRSDDIVKNEMIDAIITDYNKLPDMWFDDRPRVVRALRKRGIFVFDVYQGEEDF